MNKLLTIGRVLKPRGLAGEIKVQILTNRPEIFTTAKTVSIGDVDFTVARGSVQNAFAYFMLGGVDLAKAERLRNKMVQVSAEQFPLEDDEVLSTDLIGFAIVGDKSGKVLGELLGIDDHGAGDVLDCGALSIPYEDEFVVETNMTERKIVVREDLVLNVEVVQ